MGVAGARAALIAYDARGGAADAAVTLRTPRVRSDKTGAPPSHGMGQAGARQEGICSPRRGDEDDEGGESAARGCGCASPRMEGSCGDGCSTEARREGLRACRWESAVGSACEVTLCALTGAICGEDVVATGSATESDAGGTIAAGNAEGESEDWGGFDA